MIIFSQLENKIMLGDAVANVVMFVLSHSCWVDLLEHDNDKASDKISKVSNVIAQIDYYHENQLFSMPPLPFLCRSFTVGNK